jgi:hypothetical protein
MANFYKFPLYNEDDYKGRITFEAFRDYMGPLGVIASNILDVGERGGTQPQTPEDQRRSEAEAIRSFYGQENRAITTAAPEIEIGDKVSLYLPPSMVFQDGVMYEQPDLGLLGAGTASALRAGQTDIGALVAAAYASADLQSVGDLFQQGLTSEGAQVAALRISRRVSSEVQGAIETTTGVALNPNKRSAFRGVAIRSFAFDFKLIPNSKAESEQIKKIVQFFRTELYPDLASVIPVGGGVDTFSAAYKFPSKFNIKMTYAGRPVGINILPCFLNQVSVTYNPEAMSFHKDGDFQQTNISLQFMEERTLSKQDILREYGLQ